MSGTSRAVLAQGMKALGDSALVDARVNGANDVSWTVKRYNEGLRLQAGARTLRWIDWWEARSHVVTDANLTTKLSRVQPPLDRQPDLIDLLAAKLLADAERDRELAK